MSKSNLHVGMLIAISWASLSGRICRMAIVDNNGKTAVIMKGLKCIVLPSLKHVIEKSGKRLSIIFILILVLVHGYRLMKLGDNSKRSRLQNGQNGMILHVW